MSEELSSKVTSMTLMRGAGEWSIFLFAIFVISRPCPTVKLIPEDTEKEGDCDRVREDDGESDRAGDGFFEGRHGGASGLVRPLVRGGFSRRTHRERMMLAERTSKPPVMMDAATSRPSGWFCGIRSLAAKRETGGGKWHRLSSL